jgi:hypothetical protein
MEDCAAPHDCAWKCNLIIAWNLPHGPQVGNLWAPHGIRYLSLDWDESGEHILFDTNGVLLKQIKTFIDQAHAMGDCVLIHSLHGNSRYVSSASPSLIGRTDC